MRLSVTYRCCLGVVLTLLATGQSLAQQPGRGDFPEMKYGFFVGYIWIGRNDPAYYPATRNSDGSLPAGLDDLANRFDAAGFANDLSSMGIQYVLFTAWHNNMNCLWPSPAMNRWLKGHTSRRDVLRDMIAVVKAKGIKVLLYTQANEGYTLSAAEQAATGWGSRFTSTTWNRFINDLYGDLISRYGNDIEGLYFDGDVVDVRLLSTIRAAKPNLVLIRNGSSNRDYDYGDIENDWFYAAGTNAWVAPSLPSAIVMGSTWWTSVPAAGPNAAKYPPAAIFRYTVLMAGVSKSAGGPAWAAGVYPGGGWEPGVLTTMQTVGAYIAAVGPSITNTYASTAYITPGGATIASLPWGVVATRSINDAYEYIHVLTPPTGKTLVLPRPADRKIFGFARLVANGQPVTLMQNSAGVRLSLQGANAWNTLDTVIALTVAGVAPLNGPVDVSKPILSPPASQSVIPGQSVSFSVLAGSATPPTYQWQAGAVGSGVYTNLIDGGQISGATSNVLTISGATTNWALDYVVVVANKRGFVTSSPPATLTLQYLPVISTAPASQGAVTGQTVSFSVTASGAGYQWQAGPVGGTYTNLVDGPQVSGSASSTLTISSLTSNWLLAYQVVVTAPDGSITSTPPALLTFIHTNYLDFSPTTVGSWSGPVSPANGVTSISGAGLNVGDRVVFDGVVMYTNARALSTCQAWGAVELNQGGDSGLWGAALSALARFSSDQPCFLWVNGFGPGAFAGTSGYRTNRVRIELTATAAHSTADMNYLVEIDQGLTGRFSTSLLGTGVYFSGNTIALTFNVGFCARDSAQFVNYKDTIKPSGINPFIAATGTYNGLFAQTNRVQGSSGFVTLTLTTNGSYSGSLKQGTSSYAISGQFDVTGQTSKLVTRPGTNAWVAAMQLDFAGQQLRGWVSNGVSGGWVANLLADRAVFDNRTNPATPYPGRFTMRIPSATEAGAPVFVGDGYLTLNVATNGQITYSGALADTNAAVSGSAAVSWGGDVPLYVPLYGGKGSLWSWLAFDTNQPAKRLAGWLSWIKPEGAGAFYPLGLTNEVVAEGARYVPPTESLGRVIGMTNGMVIFEGGNLSLPLTNLVMLTESNKIIDLSQTNELTLALTVSNGAFGGSVRQPGMTRSNVFKGVLVQDESGGYGFFLETNRSGRVVFRPVP